MKNETFTPERIKAEADAFFEWDGEDRSLVTTTSCLLFAQHIAGLMQARSAQPAPVVPGALRDAVEYLDDNRFNSIGAGSILHRAMSEAIAAAPAQGQQVEWRTTAVMLEQANAGLAQLNGKLRAELAAQGQQVECQECERLRMQLVACGVVALSNTPESAAKARDMHPDYMSASCQDVMRAVDSEMALRAELSALKAQQAEQKPVEGIHLNPYPAKCPITGLPYFMHLEHPEHGFIPTFGGPYDSYSIPHAEGSPDELWHERELVSHRYCHDRGHWVDDEFIPLRIIHEDVLSELQDNATPQPAPAQDVAGLASSDPVAKAEFETRLRKEFESRWPKPKGVTWGAGINDYCVSEFAEGIALSYPDMWMAYKAGAMRTNQ